VADRESGRVQKTGGVKLPLSISRSPLLVGGADREFRRLIYRMLITESRLIEVRRAIARQVGVSGSQYSVMMAILHLEGDAGISIGALADYLEVSGPHITGEVRKLAARGFVRKIANPNDLRGVLVRLSAPGRKRLLDAFAYIRQVNDILFDGVPAGEFQALGEFYRKFVTNTSLALDWTKRSSGGRDSSAA
jgi:DNA-binding MarR family transcriptional regulator